MKCGSQYFLLVSGTVQAMKSKDVNITFQSALVGGGRKRGGKGQPPPDWRKRWQLPQEFLENAGIFLNPKNQDMLTDFVSEIGATRPPLDDANYPWKGGESPCSGSD